MKGSTLTFAEYFMQKKGIQTAHELSCWLKNKCVLDMIVSHFAEGLSLWPDTPQCKEIKLAGLDDRSLLKACLKTLADRAESIDNIAANIAPPIPAEDGKPPTRLTKSRWHNLLGGMQGAKIMIDLKVQAAESALARMDHEHTVSKVHTPCSSTS